MNFNFNNHRARFHITPPIMRHFSTIGLVTAKPEQNDFLKSDNIFKNVQHNFLSTFHGNLSNKSFSNPNFVNKLNSNILLQESVKNSFHTQQPKHDNYVNTKIDEKPQVYQPLPDKISSQNHLQHFVNNPEIPIISKIDDPVSPNLPKKSMKSRNRKNRKKRAKQELSSSEPKIDQKSNMTKKVENIPPKKFKKSPKKSKKCKPWHKISFNHEFMECDEPILIENSPKEGFCVKIKSSPIEISPKCSTLSISISPCSEFLKNLSTSSSSEVMSISPSSPVIRRLRLPSDCDSEDSFIVFCDEATECKNEDVSADETTDTDEDNSSSSECDVTDFCEKTDFERSTTKKKVSFKNDSELCEVHPMVQWGYAYQAARRGPWEQLARDRVRFQARVHNTSAILAPVLDANHRRKIYKDRFQQQQ